MKPIPQEWIRDYIDELLAAAKMFGDTPMGRAAIERADHALDLVKSFREHDAKISKTTQTTHDVEEEASSKPTV